MDAVSGVTSAASAPGAGGAGATDAGQGDAARPIVRLDVRPDGVGVLHLDDSREPHNTITPGLVTELRAALDRIEADAAIRAVVLVSDKPGSFVVGANIDFVSGIRFAKDAEDASLEVARQVKRLGELAAGKKPVVALVHGPALGGGFEIALACSATVATDHPSTVLGLPEVKLGLMPAANGLLRITERASLRVAIDLGLTGRNVRPREARSLGLVDDVVAPAIAHQTAAALALRLVARPRRGAKRRATPGSARDEPTRLLLEQNPIGRRVLFRRARAEAGEKTRGHYPAAGRMLDVLERYKSRGFRSAAQLEARHFGELVVSETAHRMIELFFAEGALKKDCGLDAAERERASAAPVSHVAVVGAGLMGAGIACATVQAGVTVRMKDTTDVAVGRGLRYVKDALDQRVRRGTLRPEERPVIFARLEGTTDYSGMARADLAVEAVFEDLALKHEILRELESRVSPSCVLATNTSSLLVARVAEAAAHPERVLGMHYGTPAHRVPLLEVVRHPGVDPSAVATAVAFGKRQGKTVIVVDDGPGAYTSRIVAPYLNEAIALLGEGVPVEAIDRALVDWGLPTGPLHLLDDTGIDVVAHVATALEAALGDRMRAPAAMAELRADDRKGRKNGRGFYLYRSARSGRPGAPGKDDKRVDDTVYAALGRSSGEARPKAEEIGARCMLLLVNEALRCLDEGILRSARDGDVAAVFGIGFPPFRGGPFRYVDVLGAQEVLGRTRSLEQRLGARFAPAPLLVEMARKGKRFYD